MYPVCRTSQASLKQKSGKTCSHTFRRATGRQPGLSQCEERYVNIRYTPSPPSEQGNDIGHEILHPLPFRPSSALGQSMDAQRIDRGIVQVQAQHVITRRQVFHPALPPTNGMPQGIAGNGSRFVIIEATQAPSGISPRARRSSLGVPLQRRTSWRKCGQATPWFRRSAGNRVTNSAKSGSDSLPGRAGSAWGKTCSNPDP